MKDVVEGGFVFVCNGERLLWKTGSWIFSIQESWTTLKI